MRLAAPRLETERLTLRAPEAGDWEGWAAFFGSARAQHAGGPQARPAAWRAFGHMIGHWVLRGYGSYVVTLRGSERALGLVGPYFPEGRPEREIGWTLWSAEAEGHGYAFEAARATLLQAFGPLGWTTAVSYIDAENARSIALARRLGAIEDPGAERPHDEDVVFRHPKPEARA